MVSKGTVQFLGRKRLNLPFYFIGDDDLLEIWDRPRIRSDSSAFKNCSRLQPQYGSIKQ